MAIPQKLILTPTPGAVFCRIGSSAVEMTPGEALRVSREMRECANAALAAQDGVSLFNLMAGWRTRRPQPKDPRELA